MKNPFFLRLHLLAVLLAASVPCQADTKITIRTVYAETPAQPQVQNPIVNRTVNYRRGTMRKKDDASGDGKPSLSGIANCETKTGFFVFLPGGEYRSYNVPKLRTAGDVREYLQMNPENPYHIAFVQVESRTVDTGERKTFFGFEAKHLVTTTKRAPVGSHVNGEEIIDGWYIDHDRADFMCAPDSLRAEPSYVIPTLLIEPLEFPEIHHVGPLPGGLAVKETRTVHFGKVTGGLASRIVKTEETVEELSDSPLKPSTFELPAGLRENPQLFRNGWRESVPAQPRRQ